MTYILEWTEQALDDLDDHKRVGDKSVLRKISDLLDELENNPTSGTGKPEQLRYQYAGFWSRRINRAHRILYEIDEVKRVVTVHLLKSHY